jgi:Flp pilus assembly protein TadG
MAARAFRTTKSFAQDCNGAVAIIFGLSFIALMMIIGVAIDMGRITHMKNMLINATDSAALAAGAALLDGRLNDDEIEQLAKEYFTANVNAAGQLFGTVEPMDVTVNRASGEVIIDVSGTVPMTITKIAGFGDINVPISSATRFDQRDIEMGMALDVTGSMSGTKLEDLKAAAKDLVDILLPDGGQLNKVRIGLAPYAASVNAGAYRSTVTNYYGSGHKCVHERGGPERFTDATPTGLYYLGRTSSMSCPSVSVLPMTNDKALLKNTIDTYQAGGTTAGHLGAAWAWYLISPLWSSIWPAASQPVQYGDGNTMKVVVLMTDGIFNQQYISQNGTSSDQARGVCAEMKNKGVAVYSIAFQAPTDAQLLLQECASGSSFYFAASNGAELRQAFQEIGKQLNNLRLTN